MIAAADAFVVGRPLFGNQWLALLAALACIAALLALVALLGRWLAATHPEAPASVPAQAVAPTAAATPATTPVHKLDVGSDVSPEIVPVLLATVAATLGTRARVAVIRYLGVTPPPRPSIEALMQEWSHEGRRQIYSSHKVR